MTDETTSDARADEGSTTGRRAFMAGAAGLAAGATLLGSGGPAGATPPATIIDHDLTLKYQDGTTGLPTAVGLGTGGLAKGTFSAFGDMAALAIRIKLGTGATPGDGPWLLDSADMPTGYEPASPPDDITEQGTASWIGSGQILDFTVVNDNARLLGCAWINVDGEGHAALVWSLPGQHNNGTGNVLLNYAGTVPYGAPLADGAFLYSSIVYLRDTTPPE